MSEFHGTFKDKSGNPLYPKIKAEDVTDMDLSQIGDLTDIDFDATFEEELEEN